MNTIASLRIKLRAVSTMADDYNNLVESEIKDFELQKDEMFALSAQFIDEVNEDVLRVTVANEGWIIPSVAVSKRDIDELRETAKDHLNERLSDVVKGLNTLITEARK